MTDVLVDGLPPIDPFCKDSAIFSHRAIQLHVWMLFPCSLLEHLGRIQFLWVKLSAEAELARDDLVEGEDDKFDIVAILFVPKYKIVGLISLPAQFGCRIEVEYFDVIGLWVDKKVPRTDITMNDAQGEVEVIDSLFL